MTRLALGAERVCRRHGAGPSAVAGMQARSIDISVPTVLAHMRQMRVQFTNMARRRADFLRRFAADDINASTVEDFMHEHRNAFNNSEGQRRFCALDRGSGMAQHRLPSPECLR